MKELDDGRRRFSCGDWFQVGDLMDDDEVGDCACARKFIATNSEKVPHFPDVSPRAFSSER